MNIEVDGRGALAQFSLVTPMGIVLLNLSEMLVLGEKHAAAMRLALGEGTLIPSAEPESPPGAPASPPLFEQRSPAPPAAPPPLPRVPMQMVRNADTGNDVPVPSLGNATRALLGPKGAPLCPSCKVPAEACSTNGPDSLRMYKCPECGDYVSTSSVPAA